MSRHRTTSVSLYSTTDDEYLDACDYTIGWVSTTEEEFDAALLVVDQQHARNTPFQCLNKNREFEYQLGRVGNHNIAISMPRIDSVPNAAAVVDDMKRTFPSLRFVLLVGTASGVPPLKGHGSIDEHAADVRLGDVIIGTRMVDSWSRGAVKIPGNEQKHLSSRAISTGIIEFKRRIAGGLCIEPSVASIQARQKGLEADYYNRPDPAFDRLYRVDYAHKSSTCECIARSATKGSMVIPRTLRTHDRQFRVHYGPVGSVDQRIVDARLRDELAHENTVLCFLTGISDVATKIDCIPVCGVCDYADSHQYPKWRGYAALMAASCAKELLGSMTVYMVLEMRICASVDGINRVIDGYIARLAKAEGSLSSHRKIMDKIQSRVEELESLISGIQNKHADTLRSADSDLKTANAVDEHLKRALRQIDDSIILQIKKSDLVTRDEWQELRVRVDQNTARLDTLQACMKSLNEAIDLGEEALIAAEARTGNKTLGDIAEWLRISKNARVKIASWVPSALKPGKPGPSGQPPEETTTPDQPKTSEKWRSKISLPWKKDHASSHDNSVVAETEVLGADGSSLSPCSPSNSSLRSSLERTRDNGQDSPGTGSERPSFPPPVPRKRSSSYYARCLEDTTKPRARS